MPAALAVPGPIAAPRPSPQALSRWLLAVAIMVFVMLIVGGITRLTESGLSIVRWEPVSGAIPPLGDAAWQAEFDRYKATPEYAQVNRGMDLAAFQRIFFWEYLHRLIGRLIGLAFALPLLWFWWRRAIPQGYGPRLVALLALGGLQGAIGWWMVASGLVDRPDVSHLRLAVHLGAALLIFAGLIWTALDLRAPQPVRIDRTSAFVLAVLAAQILLGALTAGLDAGYAFSSWPRMGADWFPPGGWNAGGALAANLLDNPVVVQFLHRWLAWAAAAAVLVQAWRAARTVRSAAIILCLIVVVQILLGIATLLSGVALPLAVAHQAMAALLVAALVVATHAIGSRAGAGTR